MQGRARGTGHSWFTQSCGGAWLVGPVNTLLFSPPADPSHEKPVAQAPTDMRHADLPGRTRERGKDEPRVNPDPILQKN